MNWNWLSLTLREGKWGVLLGLQLLFYTQVYSQRPIRQDSLVLIKLFEETNGYSWIRRWNLYRPMDEWHGVRLNQGRVVELSLNNNGLKGIIPREIGNLHQLLRMNLNHNLLYGFIPSELGKLEYLQFLGLSNNRLTGSIPPALSGMKGLFILDLSTQPVKWRIAKRIGVFSVFATNGTQQ